MSASKVLRRLLLREIDCKIKCLRHSVRNFATSRHYFQKPKRDLVGLDKSEIRENEKRLALRHERYFKEEIKEKNTLAFKAAIQKYIRVESTYRRGHVEFIYAALDEMEDFDVAQNLDCYKMLLQCFPPKIMVPQSIWQVEFYSFPKQQDCAQHLMEVMDRNELLPDDEFGEMVYELFGEKSHTFRRYQRMMYWRPKFKNANPWAVPKPLPNDSLELAKVALQRIQKDPAYKITAYDCSELDDSIDKTFVLSAVSPTQAQLINEQAEDKPLYVEGPFRVWVGKEALRYFVLRSDEISPRIEIYNDWVERYDDGEFGDLSKRLFGENRLEINPPEPSVHEQADGSILATAISGTSSKNSMVSWIHFLQRTHPLLAKVPIVFLIRSPPTDLDLVREAPEDAFGDRSIHRVTPVYE